MNNNYDNGTGLMISTHKLEATKMGSCEPTLNALVTELARCDLILRPGESGARFESGRTQFDPFEVQAPIVDWKVDEGPIGRGKSNAFFRDSALRLEFASGAWLVVYASGHIRWVPASALAYFSVLIGGQAAERCQGDLVAYTLGTAGADLPMPAAILEVLARDAGGTMWAERLRFPLPNGWQVSNVSCLGGNSRHGAVGLHRFRYPIAQDPRTVILEALEAVELTHDPIDAIHPRLQVLAGERLLVTKLPGFSNPSIEMEAADGMIV